MSNSWQWVGGGLISMAAVAAAQAQDSPSLRASSLAATCANCHGTGGHAVEDASVPGLAGMPASYTADQMKAFKSGARPATVMHQIAKGYSDAQIEQIAAYFAAQKK
ncbi:MAG: c-type cytochrome [Burkholderiaceae bacterium]|nr:c-type cytochrome [Burkholderiaceae bacterium]